MVTLAQAKKYLVVDFSEDDDIIQLCLDSAIQRLETYVSRSLRARTETVTIPPSGVLPIFFSGVTVASASGDYKVCHDGIMTIHAPVGTTITLDYSDEGGKDFDLAILKLVVYQYENRDTYTADLPLDVQMIVNQYRRIVL